MNKLIKGVLLFIALILPVLIFVFLKMFGKNQFDIPIFNHTEISDGANCDDIALPHTVKEIKGTLGSMMSMSVANIYHVMPNGISTAELKGLMVAKDRLTGNDVAIYSIAVLDSLNNIKELRQTYQIGGIWELHEMLIHKLTENINCQLMITGNKSLVLVDKEGKIRGYYDGKDEEEIDRLILESKILLYADGE